MVCLCHRDDNDSLVGGGGSAATCGIAIAIHTGYLQQLWLFVQNFNIADGQSLCRFSRGIGNFVRGTKIGKETAGNTIVECHDKGNSVLAAGFIDADQILFGEESKRSDDHGSQRALGVQDILAG
jgi:hypothetical protein